MRRGQKVEILLIATAVIAISASWIFNTPTAYVLMGVAVALMVTALVAQQYRFKREDARRRAEVERIFQDWLDNNDNNEEN